MARRPTAGGTEAGDGAQASRDRARPPRPRALRRYGQNHLIDGNVLAAIVRQAGVDVGDVVLEVGAADGRLTRPLLGRASVVHAFEVDMRYETRLSRLAAAHDNLHAHMGDALRADLAGLDPPPTVLAANLAYNIAIPLIMTSIVELPTLRRWAVMVQRELGERLFAVPRTKAYAAVSVLVQLACRREEARPVPATAFRPRPRVDSQFVTFVRRRPPDDSGMPVDDVPPVTFEEYTAIGRLVRLAFGQRRKVLSTTLAGAPHGGIMLSREGVRRALDELGLSAAARPEELSPSQWVMFARRLAWSDPHAPAGQGARSDPFAEDTP